MACLEPCKTYRKELFVKIVNGIKPEIEEWEFSVHFRLGFQENSIYTLHLCFSG